MAACKCIQVVVPLAERPASSCTALKKLLSWRIQARTRAASVSSRFAQLDGGPDSEELLMELDWLLEDAVGGGTVRRNGNNGSGSSSRKVSGWRQLKAAIDLEEHARGGHEDSGEVSLRASLDELEESWRQRIELRRPFQYIVGCSHWRDLVLAVQEGVLIPRPETEQLIDLAAAAMEKNGGSLKKGIWADLGTGSGAIAIGLARLLDTEGSVLAVDASDIALAISEGNVRRYKLEETVTVLRGSWFTPLNGKAGELSGVVSNPPYIPSRNLSKLQAEVGKHEPMCALDGGDKGIDHLLQICNGSCWALKSGGFLALETDGGEQAEAVADYLSKKPFEDVKVVKDFADIGRFVTAYHS